MRDYKEKAQLFHLLSHPVRLQILDELRKHKSCVCHLQAVTNRPQAYVSQQLRVLRDANLVVDQKDGQNVYYQFDDQLLLELLERMLGCPAPFTSLPDCSCPFCTA